MFHWLLNVILLLFAVAFGSMLIIGGETSYSLFALLGVNGQENQMICCAVVWMLFFAWLVILGVRRAKIHRDVMTAIKQNKLDSGAKRAKKYYQQNRLLFWKLRLYIAYVEKDKVFLQEFQEENAKRKSGHTKYILSSACLFLLDFLSGTGAMNAELAPLICETEKIQGSGRLSFLLKMVQCCLQNDTKNLRAHLDAMPQNFCSTSIEIIDVLRAFSKNTYPKK